MMGKLLTLRGKPQADDALCLAGGDRLPLRRTSMRPASARRNATRRTGPHQALPVRLAGGRQRAGGLGGADRAIRATFRDEAQDRRLDADIVLRRRWGVVGHGSTLPRRAPRGKMRAQ